ECGADNRAAGDACSRLARIADRAGVAVAARRPVRLRRLRADARCGVAGADVVTLIQCGADDGTAGDTAAALTGVALRTGIAVAAGRTVRRVRIRAGPGGWVARPNRVTLIQRGTEDWIHADANACLAGVGLCAGIAIVARR